MKKLLQYLFYNVLTVFILLAVLEMASRAFLHKIYNRDFDSALIVDNKYFTSAGLKENATGIVWGKQFHTDSFGCRSNSTYHSGKKKWLFIGDSVTEGVGMDDSDTFASLVNSDNDSLNILNYSLIGYSVSDYYNVLRSVLKNNERDIKRATVFFCLNDVYGPTPASQLPVMAKHNWQGRLNSFLQNRYATYKLVKLILYKNSDRYFKYDEQFYKPGDAHFAVAMSYLRQCDSVCKAAGVQMDVVILPYRNQVGGRDKKNDKPQVMLQDYLLKNHIAFADALPYLSKQTRFRNLYLFGDEIHFSAEGHKVISEFIRSF
jgi:lysophospholipase L1-like esterase